MENSVAVTNVPPAHDKPLLRFVMCGNVGDGKSTLIDRLLHESKRLDDDRLAALDAESRKARTQGDDLDRASPLGALTAERERGIEIDVAYRIFASGKRHFIIADTSGHDRYTRTMVAGASTAAAAVVLIDARKGVQTQTRRLSHLVALLGIRKVCVAVNKLDLLGYAQDAFERIDATYRAFAQSIGLNDVVCVPVSALKGDNVTARSPATPWYRGPTLIDYLDEIDIEAGRSERPFRMVVQWVNRADEDIRVLSGRVLSGVVRSGERVRILPSGRETTVARLVDRSTAPAIALTSESITLTLTDEIDVSRGDMLADSRSPPGIADQFEATIVWMADAPMLPGRGYLLKCAAGTVGATLATPKYRLNVDTLEHVAARTLGLNDIGVCNLHLDQPIPFDPYIDNRDTGGFILIDPATNDAIGAGLLHFALRRSQNIHWQAIDVDKRAHAALKGHRPCVVWFTGLSGAGKSTIANLVERRLHAMGLHTCLLDGDNVRHGLSQDLGFTPADRVENIRRVAEVARLMVEAGLVVLVSFISPFRAERRFARGLVEAGEFCEVYIDAPLEVAESRDRKGLYAKARRGDLVNFTGLDSPYETPEHPEVVIDTTRSSAEMAAEMVVAQLRKMRVFAPPSIGGVGETAV